MRPTLTGGDGTPSLVWRLDPPALAIASAPLGGGLGPRHWVINMTVPAGYDRPDPAGHLAEVAAGLGLAGPGVGLMTAVPVAEHVTESDGGVVVTATIGLGSIGWAAAPDGDHRREPRSRHAEAAPSRRRGSAADSAVPGPGTINIVAHLPEPLAPAALVNAVATVAEAKAQALWDLGVAATGTATDAICLLCPPSGPAAPYGGPRSTWGARLARAVHAAVLRAGAVELGLDPADPSVTRANG